jgi:energy-converting hydrogenase Eha subunit F
MTPTEFRAREKDNREVYDWILRLVPPDRPGVPLTRLPEEIKEQFRRANIHTGDVTDLLSAAVDKIDWEGCIMPCAA